MENQQRTFFYYFKRKITDFAFNFNLSSLMNIDIDLFTTRIFFENFLQL